MIINKLKLNLKHCGITPTVDAAQGDILSRTLEIFLYNGEDAYLLPDNLAVLIHYKKADGKGGEYDTLPDGTPAWSASKNKLIIHLAPQVLTFPGSVSMTISLVTDGQQLSTFPVQINVLPEAKALSENSEDYFNITGFLVAPGNAEPGQFLKIQAVNSEGRVTQVESGFPEQTPADWSANEEEPGYILNRPFYSEIREGLILPECQPVYDADDTMFLLQDIVSLVAGQAYTVHWNGTAYTCVAQDLSVLDVGGSVIGLGDVDLAFPDMGFTGNGEPFVILFMDETAAGLMGCGVGIMAIDGSTELTISITGVMETVVPIPKKYLTNARGQKKYTIDLDNGAADVAVETLMAMDAAEIQSSLTVLYNGIQHSADIVEMNAEESGGMTVCWIIFSMNHGLGTTINFQYHNIGGLSFLRTGRNVIYNFQKSDHCLYVKRPNEEVPRWDSFDDYAFPGIMLRSTTSGSIKTFWITVDDSGTLTATEKSI